MNPRNETWALFFAAMAGVGMLFGGTHAASVFAGLCSLRHCALMICDAIKERAQ